MKVRCLDCYEENDPHAERCARCGRSLDDAHKRQVRDGFAIQHQDAPGIVKKSIPPKKVW